MTPTDPLGGPVRETEDSLTTLPANLPEPTDDGAADHLVGRGMSIARLRGTAGTAVELGDLPVGRTVVFVYPRTGRPARAMPEGWDDIPGARGCTAELRGVSQALDALRSAGAAAVFGLSTQDSAYQAEAARRLGLGFPLLADPTMRVGRDLDLPLFTIDGATYYQRLTLVVQDGVIEHVFYPVFPPDTHVDEVVAWLRRRRR